MLRFRFAPLQPLVSEFKVEQGFVEAGSIRPRPTPDRDGNRIPVELGILELAGALPYFPRLTENRSGFDKHKPLISVDVGSLHHGVLKDQALTQSPPGSKTTVVGA